MIFMTPNLNVNFLNALFLILKRKKIDFLSKIASCRSSDHFTPPPYKTAPNSIRTKLGLRSIYSQVWPGHGLYPSLTIFPIFLLSRVYILYLNTEHNYPVEIRDRCTPAHPSAYSREKLTPMFTTFLWNYILFFFIFDIWWRILDEWNLIKHLSRLSWSVLAQFMLLLWFRK